MSDRHPCQSCSAPATLFLCSRCTQELRAQLQSLAYGPTVNGRNTAGLLDALHDVELKQTKLGNTGGHRKKGDEMPIPFLPDTGRMDKDHHPVLSPQGWASRLIVNARNILTTIARDICESRGIDVMRAFRVVPDGFVGPLMPGWSRARGQWDPTTAEVAIWLAGAVHAIACDESGGQWRGEVDSLVRQIQRAVDRPVKIELLGFCITQVEGGTCGTTLRAPEDAIEVRCRKCRTTRRCDTVRAQGQSDAHRALIPWAKVLETNKTQPEDRRVPDRKLRDWREVGLIKPRQYQYADGSHGNVRHEPDDVELFKWDDIVQLRSRKVAWGERKRARAAK